MLNYYQLVLRNCNALYKKKCIILTSQIVSKIDSAVNIQHMQIRLDAFDAFINRGEENEATHMLEETEGIFDIIQNSHLSNISRII